MHCVNLCVVFSYFEIHFVYMKKYSDSILLKSII